MSRRPPSPVSARRAPSGTSGGAATGRPSGASGGAAATSGRSSGRAGTAPRTGAPRAGSWRRDRGTAPSAESRPARVARLVSVRALVLGVVLLAGFTLVFPTVRAYLAQRAELDALATQVTQAEQEQEDLRRELDRWNDPAYVAAQARARLGYVLPGETSYRVIDPEVVEEATVDGTPAESVEGPTVPAGAGETPWYTTVWESVRLAGDAEIPGEGSQG